jgi:ABC-type lipoprotein release transport system permease subunit
LNLSDLALRQRSELTFLAAAGMPVAMTLMGSFLPALRAVLVDPLTAIRME